MRPKPHVAIVVDSAASLPENPARRPQLYVVPMRVTLDGETYADGHDLSPTEFYRRLRMSPTPPSTSTSSPSPASFFEAIGRAAAEAQSVLCLTVASQFSASFDSASTAAREAEDAFPGAQVSVLDTGSAAGGEGLIALAAWRSAVRVEGLPEVKAAAQKVMPRL